MVLERLRSIEGDVDGDAVHACVRLDLPAALVVPFERGGPATTRAATPLDRDAAGPGTDVPEVFAGTRSQCRQRDGADRLLRDLPVVIEAVVGQDRRMPL